MWEYRYDAKNIRMSRLWSAIGKRSNVLGMYMSLLNFPNTSKIHVKYITSYKNVWVGLTEIIILWVYYTIPFGLKLVSTNINYLVRVYYCHNISFKWSFFLCTYYLGWLSCLISFAWAQSSWKERKEIENMQNWKILAQSGTRTHYLWVRSLMLYRLSCAGLAEELNFYVGFIHTCNLIYRHK